MNPKYQRVADRIKGLIEEGHRVAGLERHVELIGRTIEDKVPLHAWLVKVENILSTVFGNKSAHYLQTKEVLGAGPRNAYGVNKMIGVLTGAHTEQFTF